jgi:formyl-CoA transferase
MGGAMSANGESGGPPLFVSAGVADSGSGLHCAIGILAALRQRDQTGLGDFVEISMQDAVVNLTRIRMIETLATDEPMARAGNRVWGAPSVVYPCHPGGPDDYVTIYIGGDAWDSLLAICGRADLIGDERYSTAEARSERQDEVEAIVSAWTSTKLKHDVMTDLTDLGIPCAAVLDTREVLDDPHLKAREMVVDVDDPNRGTYKAFGCPIKISSNTVAVRPPPLLGEHSVEVLSSILDIGAVEIERLERDGVI